MRKLNAQQLVNMCNGTASEVFAADGAISSVVIDSRKVSDDSLFIAIVGENHDAHDYVAQVIARGNTYALVNDDFKADLPNLIRVKDTTQALGLLASNYRQLFTIPVVAITGSNGKTTVKEMLRCV
ncbi:MAG: UDP-N-acetylmuramoyl-tripeptide--D-alanyl-D-alanine ligase, partial [Neisseriales bacterium]